MLFVAAAEPGAYPQQPAWSDAGRNGNSEPAPPPAPPASSGQWTTYPPPDASRSGAPHHSAGQPSGAYPGPSSMPQHGSSSGAVQCSLLRISACLLWVGGHAAKPHVMTPHVMTSWTKCSATELVQDNASVCGHAAHSSSYMTCRRISCSDSHSAAWVSAIHSGTDRGPKVCKICGQLSQL